MQYKILGKTGLNVSVVAFGGAPIGLSNYLETWDTAQQETESQAIAAIHKALEVGINYFDTAFGYGQGRSEQIIGKALQNVQQRPLLATKVLPPFQYNAIFDSVEKSCANLGVETIDVFQLHGNIWNDTHVSQVLNQGGIDALLQLKQQGKVRFIGFTAEAGTTGSYALLRSGHFDVLQIAYNVLYQDACNLMYSPASGIIVEAKEREMGVVTMRSLTSGVFQKLMKMQQPGIEQQLDLNALCLNYVLSNPYIDSAIVGMRQSEEVEKNTLIADQTDKRIDLTALHERYV
jgi:aryl-alcohol dehydrogenase-like predicted oxidoreductase